MREMRVIGEQSRWIDSREIAKLVVRIVHAIVQMKYGLWIRSRKLKFGLIWFWAVRGKEMITGSPSPKKVDTDSLV